MVRDYGISDTYTWTPGTGDEGNYSLQVWVRPNGSTADYTAWRGMSFEILNMAPAIGSIVSNVEFPAGSGTAITLRAIASGGPNLAIQVLAAFARNRRMDDSSKLQPEQQFHVDSRS